MLSTAPRRRARRSWLVALVALASVLLPVAPAQAGVTVPVGFTLTYQSTVLGGLSGTVTFESNTAWSYSISICRRSSYVPVFTSVYVSGVSWAYWDQGGTPTDYTANCPYPYRPALRTGYVEMGSLVTGVSFIMRGVYFDPYTNTARERSDGAYYDNPLN